MYLKNFQTLTFANTVLIVFNHDCWDITEQAPGRDDHDKNTPSFQEQDQKCLHTSVDSEPQSL